MIISQKCDLGLEVNIKVWNVLLDQGVQLEGEDDGDDDHDDCDHICPWCS